MQSFGSHGLRHKVLNGSLSFLQFRETMVVPSVGPVVKTVRTLSSNIGEEGLPSSHLYVPKEKASKQVSILSPVLDWMFSTSQIQEIRENLKIREMPSVDVECLATQWHRRKALEAEVQRLETAREANAELIRRKLGSGTSKEDVEPLLQEGRRLRSDSKAADVALSELGDRLVPKLLQLPNTIHPTTPKDGFRIARVHGVRPVHRQRGPFGDGFHSTEIGLGSYYLRGRHAVAELATLDFFAERFMGHDFVPFSNPDFCKPIVVEGCGHRFDDPEETFHLKTTSPCPDTNVHRVNDLHLVGSASLWPFAAFYTKVSVNERHLPLKHFALGRRYSPLAPGLRRFSPSNASQASRVHFFVATADDDAAEVYDRCLEIVESAYSELGVHFQTMQVPAVKLLPAECRRVEIQMWSSASQAYGTVANVASCGDYIGKRLWMCYEKGDDTREFLQVVHGTAISFPEFLACLTVNQNGTEFPPALIPYMSGYGVE